jgi:uncharacterized glyoxalase superfamily protein PhnB
MHVAVRADDLVDVSSIHARPWGERNFSFSDPDGYLWEYGQPRV